MLEHGKVWRIVTQCDKKATQSWRACQSVTTEEKKCIRKLRAWKAEKENENEKQKRKWINETLRESVIMHI